MKKKIERKFFTLLELFICLAIIAVASTFLGIKGYALLQKAKFSSASGKLTLRLKECRSLALAHGEDVVFFLRNEAGGIIYLTGFEGGHMKEERLENFSFSFNDEHQVSIALRFFSTGSVRPLGKLNLFSKRKEESDQLSIDLGALLELEEGADDSARL